MSSSSRNRTFVLLLWMAITVVASAFTPDLSKKNIPNKPAFIEPEISQGPSSSTPQVPRNNKSRRESAVLVEWERLSELERRIEDGVHYEHFPEDQRFGTSAKRNARKQARDGAGDSVRGVFCGYRSTAEERSRLKSANPNDCD